MKALGLITFAALLAADSAILPVVQFIVGLIALPLSIYAAVTARRALEAVAPRIAAAAEEGAELLEQLGDDTPDA